MTSRVLISRVLKTVTLVTALLLPIGPAAALDLSEWVQGLRVTPFVSERFEYQSNVFQTPSRAETDLIFKTIPGILIEYGSGANWLSLGYRVEILKFLNLSSQDATHHIFLGQLHLEANRLIFNVSDNYANTTDPPGSELIGRIENRTNTFVPDVEFRLTDRFAIGVNASWIHVEFPTIPQLDRNEYSGGGSVFWRFQPKSDLRLTYNYGVKEFNSAGIRDVTRHVVLLGVRGELSSKFTSTFRIGYEDRQPNGNAPGLKSYSGFVLGGDSTFKFSDRTSISLLTDRSVSESIFADELWFVSTTGTLVLNHRFGPKVAANARVTAGENDYQLKTALEGSQPKWRNDLIIGWGAGVSYDVQPWLRLALDFLHTDRESNFRQFSYKQDKVAATITLQF